MPAEIIKIEVKVSCKECGTCVILDGVHKTGGYQDQYSASSWTYVDVTDFPTDWKRYGDSCYGTDITCQEFYCPLHDKLAPKKIGRPKRFYVLGGK